VEKSKGGMGTGPAVIRCEGANMDGLKVPCQILNVWRDACGKMLRHLFFVL